MKRRALLRHLAVGGTLAAAGCLESVSLAADRPEASDVFESYRFEESDLVVRFRDDVDVRSAALYDSSTDEEHETVDRPRGPVRFPVVFPDRPETYVSGTLHVRAETADGQVDRRIPGTVHGHVDGVEVRPDGRARFAVENQGDAPLLVRFVAIHGEDVPNPTVDPQADSFDRSSFDPGPGVVGVGRNRPLSPSRTDLVVPSGETAPFETTYAPFAFPGGTEAAACEGAERTAEVAVVHASGGSAAYTLPFRLAGDPTRLDGRTAAVCDGPDDTEDAR
ncbi:hypothetical protein [Halomarina ordinaria]|uniref:Lipoprotein n=1 Tax=Halomarina ordinaria TaxID=3033939 RepID=A0ABD5U7G6_9EURY|nr:hypothetical protein [Halomarina sp. PSRA2]